MRCAAARATSSNAFGTLKRASRLAAVARAAPAASARAGAQDDARGRPPRPTAGPGAPNTAASATAGCASSTASTSAGATFSPPVTIMSALRPVTMQAPALVEAAEVAGAQAPPPRDGRAGDEDLAVGRDRDADAGQRPAGRLEVAGLGDRDREHACVRP